MTKEAFRLDALICVLKTQFGCYTNLPATRRRETYDF